MLRRLLMLAVVCLIPNLCAAQNVTIGAPDLQGDVLQQTARVDAGVDGICWYWLTSDPINGTHCYRVIDRGEMPALNLNPGNWTEIDWDVWFDELSEWGQFGGPGTIEEAAYLTDSLTYAINVGGSENFESAYWYLGWSLDLEDVLAESVLYPE